MSRADRPRLRRVFLTLLAALAIAAALSGSALAACEKTSLPAIEQDVMCPICGTTLGDANGEQANDERNYIRSLVAKCLTKDQIKIRLVAVYGQDVIATPKKSGFGLTAYIVPVAGIALAALFVLLGARRWRRERAAEPPPAFAAGPDPRAGELDADMGKYDL